MDTSPEQIRRLCPRFRVLIMGRRNAGKTTILEKMSGCEAGVKPEIRDKSGHLVVWASSLAYIITSRASERRMTQPFSRQGSRFVIDALMITYTNHLIDQTSGWDEHHRVRDKIPEQPAFRLSRFSRNRSWSRNRWRKRASDRIHSSFH